ITHLEDILSTDPMRGQFGLGHTRWATHGRPTEENAHPHRDCSGRIVVAHNGIIENYMSLKRKLTAEGHKFTTETDTEVIAHLLEKHFSGNLEDAVIKTLPELKRLFALRSVSGSARTCLPSRASRPTSHKRWGPSVRAIRWSSAPPMAKASLHRMCRR